MLTYKIKGIYGNKFGVQKYYREGKPLIYLTLFPNRQFALF